MTPATPSIPQTTTGLWAVQANLGSRESAKAIEDACTALGFDYITFDAIPFSDEPPAVPTGQPTLFYGATRCTALVAESGRWTPGVYFDEPSFRYRSTLEHWGDLMLNHAAQFSTFAELAEADLGSEMFFVRPDRDLKEFAGLTMTGEELRAWAASVVDLGAEAVHTTAATVVVSAPVRSIEREWRAFIVDGRVVGASRYRSYGKPDVVRELPDGVRDLVANAVAIWSPAPVFVLDVGVAAGHFQIIEANCFHSAGFYEADITAVIAAVSAYAFSETPSS